MTNLKAVVCAVIVLALVFVTDSEAQASPKPYRIGVTPVIVVNVLAGCTDHTNPNNGTEWTYSYVKESQTFFREINSYADGSLALRRDETGNWIEYTNTTSTPAGEVRLTFSFGRIYITKSFNTPDHDNETYFFFGSEWPGQLFLSAIENQENGDLCAYSGHGKFASLHIVACGDPLPADDLVWLGECPTELDFELYAVEPVQVTYQASALVSHKPMATRVTIRAVPGTKAEAECDTLLSAMSGNSIDVGLAISDGVGPALEFSELISAEDFQDFRREGLGCIARVYLATNVIPGNERRFEFRAFVNSSESVPERSRSNNEKLIGMPVVTTKSLRVAFVPMVPCADCQFAPSSVSDGVAITQQRAKDELPVLFPIAEHAYSDFIAPFAYSTADTSGGSTFGLLVDLLEIATIGKRIDPFADVTVGVAPPEYLPWRGQVADTRGVTIPLLAPSAIVSEGNSQPVVTHEIGHQFGLYSGVKLTVAGICVAGCEEYDTNKSLELAEGYWPGPRGDGEVRGAACFMGSPPAGQQIGNRGIWIHADDYNALLQRFISATDPAALWVTGWIKKSGEIIISRTYYFPAANLTESVDTGTPDVLEVTTKNAAGAALSQLRIPIQFAVQDAASLQQLESVPFGVMIPVSAQTVTVEVARRGPVSSNAILIPPFVTALKDAVSRIPDSSFLITSPHAKLAMIADADQYGKLSEDNKKKPAGQMLDRLRQKTAMWLSAEPPADRRFTSKSELLALIDAVANSLEVSVNEAAVSPNFSVVPAAKVSAKR